MILYLHLQRIKIFSSAVHPGFIMRFHVVCKKEAKMFLSVVIPTYNEQARISQTLATLRACLERNGWLDRTEVIVVSDGCADDTLAVAQLSAVDMNLSLVDYQPNRGKGYAVRAGMLKACGRYVGFMDADGSTSVEEMSRFIGLLERGEADGVIASRSLPGAVLPVRQSLYRVAMGKIFATIVRFALDLPYRDTQCGFKFFTGEAARHLFSLTRADRFEFDVEVLVHAKACGFRIKELPVTWRDDARSTVSPGRDGLQMLRAVWQMRRHAVAGTAAARYMGESQS